MKANFTGAYAIALLFSIIVFSVSCSKGKDTSNTPREQLVVGKWNINRVQLRIYYSGTFFKDTIIPLTPMPENFVKFDVGNAFEYRFNKNTSDLGTYQFVGTDSVISNVTSKVYRWKILTMTDVLFTVMTTTTDPAFPGAIVENYQTFVK